LITEHKSGDFLSPELKQEDTQNLSMLGYAHIGDAVYELMARTWLVKNGSITAKNLHKRTVGLVSAVAQAKAVGRLWDILDAEEREVFQRGRNTQVKSVPKNADRGDYQYATGLEALFGFLYLRGRRSRLNELFLAAVSAPENM
jgi:ribonuclease-3 family protein